MELMLELRIQEWVFQQHNDVMHAWLVQAELSFYNTFITRELFLSSWLSTYKMSEDRSVAKILKYLDEKSAVLECVW